MLLVESGSRHLYNKLVPWLYERNGDGIQIDVVTCFADAPASLRGTVYRTADYGGRSGRRRLYKLLRQQKYTNIGIICSGEPLMTKWKWTLAWKMPAKLFILNENGDFFWVQWDALSIMKRMALDRLGMTGAGVVTLLARLLAFPFVLVYLLAYAFLFHGIRRMRVLTGRRKLRREDDTPVVAS